MQQYDAPSSSGAAPHDKRASSRWMVLFTVLIMTFMSTLDSSIVNVALPVMRSSLGASLDAIQWVASLYLVAICAVLLVFGRLGDLIGKGRLFQAGVVVFSLGSLACGLSSSLELLLASRALQGVGAGAAMATNMGIITEAFPARERGRALGVLASFVALGMMCGPVLGGIIVESLPWEAIFLINVPVGVAALVLGTKTLPPGVRRVGESMDTLGACLLIPGMALALCSITMVEGGSSAMSWLALGAAVVLLVLFFCVERTTSSPLVDLAVMRDPLFLMNAAAALISFVAIGSTEIVLPFYLQDARGFAPWMAGLLFAVIPLVNIVAGPVSGTLSDRVGRHAPACVGLAIYVVGIAAVGFLGPQSGLATIVGSIAIMSLGTSVFQSPNNALFMEGVPERSLGFVGSCVGLSQNMGMALGISGGMAVLTSKMSEAAGKEVWSYASAGAQSFFYGYRWAYLATAALVAVGFVICVVRWLVARQRKADLRAQRNAAVSGD